MRIIGSFEKENLARRFSLFLEKEKIGNILEDTYDKKQRKAIYNIWVSNEDDLSKAADFYNEFLQDPINSKFTVKYKDISIEEQNGPVRVEVQSENADPAAMKRAYPYLATYLFLLVCVCLYFINLAQEITLSKKYNLKEQVLLTPLQKSLLYDVPSEREKLERVIIKYHLDTSKKLENPPAEAQKEIEDIEKTPSWIGFADIILRKLQKQKPAEYESSLFEKIRQGQVYRLFTPVVLHSGFLHILFNMLWLWYLGKQLEPRLRFIRYTLFIIIAGVITDTAQYLMGGPYFLGFSGVITAMVGYIYVRQRIAPWEGYNIPNAVFYFIGFFILAMLFLQLGSFALQIFKPKLGFTPGIANTAHIVGALIGIILAKTPFFSWRTSE